MKITALEEYGLRCMICFSAAPDGKLTLPEISSQEGLSLPYAGKLLMLLKKAGLVNRCPQERILLLIPSKEKEITSPP